MSFLRSAAQVAVLCYLSDTGPETGALRVIPGSHHRGLPLHALLPAAHDGDELAPGHPALADHAQQVTLGARAGDAAVIDYRLLHATHANTSDRRRDCLLLSFTPAWRDLPPEVRAHLIQHPAQPAAREAAPGPLLPRYEDERADLPLDRNAPADSRVSRSGRVSSAMRA